MISRIKNTINQYPRQYWLVFTILMVAWLLHSLMWPYLMLYISQRLQKPLSDVSSLMMINAVTGMMTTFLGGAIADRFGRKGVIVFSLIFCGVGWFFFQAAGTLPVFALLMAATGAMTPLYRLAADSMVSDLVPMEDRLNAYSLLRMGNNLGVTIGPAIGGFIASFSYNYSFMIIGVGMSLLGILAIFYTRETKPSLVRNDSLPKEMSGGYLRIIRDRIFMMILAAFSFVRIGSSILWLLLAAYAVQNYGLSEKLFGLIPATNGLMVILFQMAISRRMNRHKPESAMALGALIFSLAFFSISFSRGFWGFWLCMVVATIGEMILLPTTTTYTSHLAPPDMRARYMSLYTLTTALGSGLGPLIGGLMSDFFGARSMWYSAGTAAFIGFLLFLLIVRQKRLVEKPTSITP